MSQVKRNTSRRPNLYVVCEDAYDTPLCKDELAMRLVRGERIHLEPVGELVYDGSNLSTIKVVIDSDFYQCAITHQLAKNKQARHTGGGGDLRPYSDTSPEPLDSSEAIPAALLAPQCLDIDGQQPYRRESFHRHFRLQVYPDAVYLTNSEGYTPSLPADWWDCLAEERNMREKFLCAETEPPLDDMGLGCAGELAELYHGE